MALWYLPVIAQYASSLFSSNAQQDALEKYATAARTKANYTFANYENMRTQYTMQNVEALTNARLQAHRQEASVSTAVNEEMIGGGRTAQALKNVAYSDEGRKATSIMENYQNQMNTIDLAKESALISEKNTLTNIPSINNTGLLGLAANAVTAYYGDKAQTEATNLMRQKAGIGLGDNTDPLTNLFTSSGYLGTNFYDYYKNLNNDYTYTGSVNYFGG